MKAINNRGVITVFLSIILSSIFLVAGVFSDAARLRLAYAQVQRANKTAIGSVLAGYNNQLKDQYGLFGFYLDDSTLFDSFEEYFVKNLNVDENNFLYNYTIEDIKLKQPLNLENRQIFEHQIMEFMKYRAPYELANDLLAKIDGIKNISSGAKVYKRKIETDEKAGEMGSSQLDMRDKAAVINDCNISEAITEQKNRYLNEIKREEECSERLGRLQDMYSNQSDNNDRKGLIEEMNSLQRELSNIRQSKSEIRSNVINSLEQYKSLNVQALERANTINVQKNGLLERIDGELEFAKENHEGIKELKKSYEESLIFMKKIISEDNAHEVAGSLERNAAVSSSIISRAGGSETDFLAAIDNISETVNINYKFNISSPSTSEDEDNRGKVKQALKDIFTEKPDTMIIENLLLARLPSKKVFSGEKYSEEDEIKKWHGTDFENIASVDAELDYLAGKENKFGEMAFRIAEELYINEYIMGTFKHDVPLLEGENESAAYNMRSKDKTKRDGYFSCFEVEYIINGNKDEAINSMLVKSEILAIRLISNVIHIYTDTSKMTRITSLAAALSSWSAGLSTPWIQTMLVFSWAMLESAYDLEQLAQGKKILLFKTKNQWKTDLSGAVDKKKTDNADNNPFCLSYQDYLKVFLLLTGKEKKLARTQDLIQLNVGISSPGFLVEGCSTVLEADTTVSIKNMFVAIPNFTHKERENLSRSYINAKMFTGF